jgi:hypothetical protein
MGESNIRSIAFSGVCSSGPEHPVQYLVGKTSRVVDPVLSILKTVGTAYVLNRKQGKNPRALRCPTLTHGSRKTPRLVCCDADSGRTDVSEIKKIVIFSGNSCRNYRAPALSAAGNGSRRSDYANSACGGGAQREILAFPEKVAAATREEGMAPNRRSR